MLRQFLALQVIILGLISLITYYWNLPQSRNYLFLGNITAALCISSILWFGERIILKKSIALAASVIVFKYAFLVGIFYFIKLDTEIKQQSFVFGLLTLIPMLMFIVIKLRSFMLNEIEEREEL